MFLFLLMILFGFLWFSKRKSVMYNCLTCRAISYTHTCLKLVVGRHCTAAFLSPTMNSCTISSLVLFYGPALLLGTTESTVETQIL